MSGQEPGLATTATVTLGCLALQGPKRAGCHDPSAITRLAWECHRRTSITADLDPLAVPLTQAALYAQPLLIWQGSGPLPALPTGAADRLAAWLHRGGMLLVDAADPVGSAGRAAFLAGVEEVLAAALGGSPAEAVPADHVLYRSFYLLRGIGEQRPQARAIRFGQRLGVVFSGEPWLAGLAMQSDDTPSYPGLLPSASDREQVLRMTINWLMYALCLDYKDDQVHLPYLLERRGP